MAIDASLLMEVTKFLCLSSIRTYSQGTSENGTGSEPGHHYCSNVENSGLVPQVGTSLNRPSNYSSKGTKDTVPSIPFHHKTLTLLACNLSGSPSQQEAFREKLPKLYCNPGEGVHSTNTPLTSRRDLDPYKATPTQALDFMTDPLEQGLSYSAMNTVRSAL